MSTNQSCRWSNTVVAHVVAIIHTFKLAMYYQIIKGDISSVVVVYNMDGSKNNFTVCLGDLCWETWPSVGCHSQLSILERHL